jgi:hypothetical protein
MKLFQYAIRVFVFVGSVAGFFGGWALFAHSNKPVAAQVSMPSVAPLTPLNFDAPISVQPIQPTAPMPRTQMTMPRLRTRGS